MDKIVKAALVYRRAYWRYQQNEGEIANGGKDFGREKLQNEMEDAEIALDEALDEKFGIGWDLIPMDYLERK